MSLSLRIKATTGENNAPNFSTRFKNVLEQLTQNWPVLLLLLIMILIVSVILPWLGMLQTVVFFIGLAFYLSAELVSTAKQAFSSGDYRKFSLLLLASLLTLVAVIEAVVLLFIAKKITLVGLLAVGVFGLIMFACPITFKLLKRKAGERFSSVKRAFGWNPKSNRPALKSLSKGFLSVFSLVMGIISLKSILHALLGSSLGVVLACIPVGLLFLYSMVYSLTSIGSVIMEVKATDNFMKRCGEELSGLVQVVTIKSEKLDEVLEDKLQLELASQTFNNENAALDELASLLDNNEVISANDNISDDVNNTSTIIQRPVGKYTVDQQNKEIVLSDQAGDRDNDDDDSVDEHGMI